MAAFWLHKAARVIFLLKSGCMKSVQSALEIPSPIKLCIITELSVNCVFKVKMLLSIMDVFFNYLITLM